MNYSIKGSKSFDYKTSITIRLEDNNTEKEIEIFVPLKHLNNCQKALDRPLIYCEIKLILAWSKSCVITSKAKRDAEPDPDPVVAAINNPANATFKIKDTKFYVPVATLSTEDDNKLLE